MKEIFLYRRVENEKILVITTGGTIAMKKIGKPAD